jgi:hypothetical protein
MDIEIKIENENNVEIDKLKFQKMVFLFNALDSGWSIKKNKDSYIFTKNHEGKNQKRYFSGRMLETLYRIYSTPGYNIAHVDSHKALMVLYT